MNPEIIDIPIREIKPFVSRARPRAPFERMVASIKEHGVKIPIQVRRLKSENRGQRTPWKYERIVGEGRILACKELRRETVPAIVVDVSEGEIVGRFLAENVLRKKLPWQDKARLIAAEVRDQKSAVSKQELNRLASSYFITPLHVRKLLRILQQASPKVRETLDKLTVEEAETLTSLPAKGQQIIVETLEVEQLSPDQIPALVSKARELKHGGVELSKSALKQSLRRVDEDLARLRQSLKLKRLHHALGPENLRLLISDTGYQKALNRRGISITKFMEATES